jgi:hypothetical protein
MAMTAAGRLQGGKRRSGPASEWTDAVLRAD